MGFSYRTVQAVVWMTVEMSMEIPICEKLLRTTDGQDNLKRGFVLIDDFYWGLASKRKKEAGEREKCI